MDDINKMLESSIMLGAISASVYKGALETSKSPKVAEKITHLFLLSELHGKEEMAQLFLGMLDKGEE